MSKRSVTYLLISILSFGLFAQKKIRFSHIASDQKLSQLVVNCIHQDRMGFMWFGTQDGLNMYDGIEVRKIFKNNPRDKNSISDNSITSLAEDKDGNLWIGTIKGGLNKYDPVTGKFTFFKNEDSNPNSLSSNNVTDVFVDENNAIWVGTGMGLDLIHPKTNSITRFDLNFEGPDKKTYPNPVVSIASVHDNKLYFAARYTIEEIDIATKKRSNYFIDLKNLNSEHVLSANFFNEKYLIITPYVNEIKIFDISSKLFVADHKDLYLKTIIDLKRKFCNGIVNDEIGLWFATEQSGLYCIDSTQVIHYVDDESIDGLKGNRINCVYTDKNKNLWIGTDEGVNLVVNNEILFNFIPETVMSPKGKSNDIMSICSGTTKSEMIFGTDGNGLFIYDVRRNERRKLDQIKSTAILSILLDRYSIFSGSWGSGLNIYDLKAKKNKHYNSDNSSLFDGNILSIAKNSNSQYFLGTFNGIYSFDSATETFKNYSMNNGLSSNEIYTLVTDKKKNELWIGTNGGGVNIMNIATGKVEIIKKVDDSTNTICSNTVNHIYIDHKRDIVWIATDNGLSAYHPQTKIFKNYYESDNLPSNYVYCVIPDSTGYLWMSTNNGISKFNPDVDNIDGIAFKNYDVADGVQSKEFIQGSYFKSQDGTIWMGGTNGINWFNPDKQNKRLPDPLIYISSLKINNAELKADSNWIFKKEVSLDYKSDQQFNIYFLCIDYQSNGRIKYSYMLDGYDNNWSVPTSLMYAEYKKLPPGEYVFMVKASNRDGIWSKDHATLTITINPPWYRTNWAYVNYVILALILLIGIPQYMNYRVVRQNKILEKKVEERTKQLAEKNADITSSIQYAKRIQEAILPNRQEIAHHLPDSFILYKPRDIVSGDFYWFGVKNNYRIMAVVDCTGHGVPGAFMSMIGHNLLNQIVDENNVSQPDEILNELHKGIQLALKQGTGQSDTTDGMDICLCALSADNKKVLFAGANRPLCVVRNGELIKLVADKFAVGGAQISAERKFNLKEFDLMPNDMIYMFSDGYADQFGGEHGKKFMMKQLNQLLITISTLPVREQHDRLYQAFENWRGQLQQIDDVLVVGIRA